VVHYWCLLPDFTEPRPSDIPPDGPVKWSTLVERTKKLETQVRALENSFRRMKGSSQLMVDGKPVLYWDQTEVEDNG
jgi:hypothetical protein